MIINQNEVIVHAEVMMSGGTFVHRLIFYVKDLNSGEIKHHQFGGYLHRGDWKCDFQLNGKRLIDIRVATQVSINGIQFKWIK